MTSTLADALDPQSVYWEGEPRDGWALLVRGHDHDPATLAAVAESEDYTPHEATEVWLHTYRRIMWCERLGWACDNNGEWHRHYEPVLANPAADSAKWTLITRLPVEVTP